MITRGVPKCFPDKLHPPKIDTIKNPIAYEFAGVFFGSPHIAVSFEHFQEIMCGINALQQARKPSIDAPYYIICIEACVRSPICTRS